MQVRSARTTSREEQETARLLQYNPLRFVREAYVRFIQGIFYAAPRGWYHWEQDPEDSEIIITDENPIKTDVLGKRPGITCTRAPIAIASLGLDDVSSYNPRVGSKTKTVLLPGTMSINCSSRVPLESEHLAWVVGEHLWALRDELRACGFFDVGRNITIGAPSSPGAIIQNDNADEWYVTVVTSPFQLARSTGVSTLNTSVVQSVRTRLYGEMHGLPHQGIPYHDGAEPPYAIINKLPAVDIDSIGGVVDSAYGEASISQHSVSVMADSANPAQEVVVRVARPGDPATRPQTLRDRTIPIDSRVVEESTNPLDPRTVET